jgi:hypothetical protein
MIIVGVDAHKRTHTCVAVDSRGQRLGEKTVPATSVGNASALKWALLKFGPELTWAIEDVRTVPGPVESELMSSGQRVGAGTDQIGDFSDGWKPPASFHAACA